jgi:hypothetical protein
VIVFVLYLLALSVLIYKTSFFGILKDNILNAKFYLTAFLIKVSALAAFYLLYMKLYGSIQYSDTGNFYRDSLAIHNIAHSNFAEFVKLMLGLQEDGKGSYIFENFLRETTTWDKAPGEILYNDNRLILRLHALIHFISFGNYFVHALFSCFLSFIGINWIYKTFKEEFKNKEIYFFLIWVLFPGVWFWTSGLFKEGPTLFLMGMLLISAKRVISYRKRSIKNLVMLLLATHLSVLFKPHLMLPILVATFLFFAIKNRTDKRVGLKYCIVFLIVFLIGNFTMELLFKKDAIKILSERQRDFMDMSDGGLFLLGEDKFARLPYDFSFVTLDSSQTPVRAKIKMGVPFIYGELTHQQDTLVCNGNTDTTSVYQLLYVIPKANSTLKPPVLIKDWISFFKALPFAIYITTLKPFFFDARNTMDLITSFENLLILLSLLWFVYNGVKNGFKNPHYIYFLSIVILALILIGVTSPNLGAIQRYRALIIPFILLTALLSSTIKDHQKLGNFFRN